MGQSGTGSIPCPQPQQAGKSSGDPKPASKPSQGMHGDPGGQIPIPTAPAQYSTESPTEENISSRIALGLLLATSSGNFLHTQCYQEGPQALNLIKLCKSLVFQLIPGPWARLSALPRARTCFFTPWEQQRTQQGLGSHLWRHGGVPWGMWGNLIQHFLSLNPVSFPAGKQSSKLNIFLKEAVRLETAGNNYYS